MEQKIYHGNLSPKDIATALMAEFNHGNMRAQSFGNDQNIVVQIATKEWLQSGGQTALSVTVKQVPDGVLIGVGNQAWLGVAASVGQTIFSALRNPWNILNRLDDLAQDIESVQLADEVNRVIEATMRSSGASFDLSERLRRLTCEYCGTANLVGESNCIACGAPMGTAQPHTCPNCGYVLKTNESRCPNCGYRL